MATFELRTDARGQVVAVRAKVRRAGAPHLSKSFPVKGTGAITTATAIQRAQAQARAWVATLEASLGLLAPQPLTAQANTRPSTARRADFLAAWQSASAAAVPSPEVEGNPLPDTALQNLLALEPDVASRCLLIFVLNTGLPVEALAGLRWQHIALAQQSLQLRSGSGLLAQQVPLVPAALEALLCLPGRKYGLVFGDNAAAIGSTLQASLGRVGQDLATLYRAAAWRWLQRGVGAGEVAVIMGRGDLALVRPGSPGAGPAPVLA